LGLEYRFLRIDPRFDHPYCREWSTIRALKRRLTIEFNSTRLCTSSMKRFWQILALLMLALMVPASMCCYGAEGCAVEVCCSECQGGHEGDQHHAPVSCPSDTISHSQVPAPITMPEMQMVELTELIQLMIRLQGELASGTESAGLPMTTAPPELRATWHFTQRTALPVRAPSIQA
jgi:hypothetical protein